MSICYKNGARSELFKEQLSINEAAVTPTRSRRFLYRFHFPAPHRYLALQCSTLPDWWLVRIFADYIAYFCFVMHDLACCPEIHFLPTNAYSMPHGETTKTLKPWCGPEVQASHILVHRTEAYPQCVNGQSGLSLISLVIGMRKLKLASQKAQLWIGTTNNHDVDLRGNARN